MSFSQIVVMTMALLSTVANASVSTKNAQPCSIGEICKATGKAVIFPPADGEQAWLELDKRCVALALPDDVYANRAHWNGRLVRVVGYAYRQPTGIFLYYKIKGRRISGGVCEGNPLIIVDKISLHPNHQ